MDRQQIGLKLALDELGQDLALDEIHDRLALQKMIYLVQAGGVHLGYTYGWYMRGPYSHDLTRDGFAIRAELRAGVSDSGFTLLWSFRRPGGGASCGGIDFG